MNCKKCGLKGHVQGNCPNLNFVIDQKSDCNVIVLDNDAKILDFVKDIEFSDDLIPKLEIKEEPLDIKSEVSENNKKSCEMLNETQILDFVKDIEFSDEVKSTGIYQKLNVIDSKMPNDKETMADRAAL